MWYGMASSLGKPIRRKAKEKREFDKCRPISNGHSQGKLVELHSAFSPPHRTHSKGPAKEARVEVVVLGLALGLCLS